jgi:hypothetical protein
MFNSILKFAFVLNQISIEKSMTFSDKPKKSWLMLKVVRNKIMTWVMNS